MNPFASNDPWPRRLEFVLEMMRDLSRQTEPQQMVATYSARMRQIVPSDAFMSLSRRGLERGRVRITRFSGWTESVNPWKSPEKLPVLDGGLLGQLIWSDEPAVIDQLQILPDDPAAPYLEGMRSLAAVPLFDQGVALNMVVLMRREPATYQREFLPEHVWMANLFGRATNTLVISERLREAYEAVDRELKAVADIQRSLLPDRLPEIPTLDLAAHYQTSKRAGGDYYDFFPLPDGNWGILMADVSGHGTPAAVLMAITHSIAHTCADPKIPPSRLLRFVNERLVSKYTGGYGSFVTAFFGIYHPAERRLVFSSAGHPAPRLRRASGAVEAVDGASGLPLGIELDEPYMDAQCILRPGDRLVLFTDGITEARSPTGDFFGEEGLDTVLLNCNCPAAQLVAKALSAVDQFTGGAAPSDDRTLLAACVS